MDATNLSERLKMVANYVDQGARLADIGSDHAYLPAYLALKGQLAYGVAGEVVRGPYENACHEVRAHGLEDVITVRLADGLAAIEASDEIDTITICGMGGTLITEILKAHPEKLANHPKLILQPNIGEKNVRMWLQANGYQIDAEELLTEDGHLYEIIVATYQPANLKELSIEDLEFGPFLRQRKGSIFQEKWTSQRAKLQRILNQMEKAQAIPVDKKAEMMAQLQRIEVVLND